MNNSLSKKDIELLNAVASMQNGNKDSFNDVYEKSYKYLYKIVYDVIKDSHTTEDLLQDTYIKIYDKIDTLQDVRTFYVWAGRIATNNALRYIQKYRKEVLVMADEEGDTDFVFENAGDDKEAFIPESIVMDKEKRRIVGDILDNLSVEQKLAVQYYYFEEMSVNDIADSMGCSSGTIKSRLNYARNAIKDAVLRIEKTQGTKLYSISALPVFYVVFKIFAEEQAGVTVNMAIAESIIAGAANGVTAMGAADTAGALVNGASAGVQPSVLANGASAGVSSVGVPESGASYTSVASTGTPESGVSYTSVASTGTPESGASYTDVASTGTPESGASYTGATSNGTPQAQVTQGISKELTKRAGKSAAKNGAKLAIKTKLAIAAAATVTVASVTTAVIINNNKSNTETSVTYDETTKPFVLDNGELGPDVQKTYLCDANLIVTYQEHDGSSLRIGDRGQDYAFVYLTAFDNSADVRDEMEEAYSEIKEHVGNGVEYYYDGDELKEYCEPVILNVRDWLSESGSDINYINDKFKGFLINTTDGWYYIENDYSKYDLIDVEYADYGGGDVEAGLFIPCKIYKVTGGADEASTDVLNNNSVLDVVDESNHKSDLSMPAPLPPISDDELKEYICDVDITVCYDSFTWMSGENEIIGDGQFSGITILTGTGDIPELNYNIYYYVETDKLGTGADVNSLYSDEYSIFEGFADNYIYGNDIQIAAEHIIKWARYALDGEDNFDNLSILKNNVPSLWIDNTGYGIVINYDDFVDGLFEDTEYVVDEYGNASDHGTRFWFTCKGKLYRNPYHEE